MPRVSVLLTTYNRPKLLEVAIQSLLDQEYTDWECIVLDDNSTDPDQVAVLAKYWMVPNFVYYKSSVTRLERNLTARYATLINIGMDLARGEFITYLCDDDFYYPDRLSKMVHVLDENPDWYVVYGKQRIIRVENGVEVETSIREPNQAAALVNANCLVDHSSVLHRKSCVDVVGKWDDSQEWWGGADGQYWEKLGKAGFRFHEVPYVLDAHVIHSGSWTREAKWKLLGTEQEGQSGL